MSVAEVTTRYSGAASFTPQWARTFAYPVVLSVSFNSIELSRKFTRKVATTEAAASKKTMHAALSAPAWRIILAPVRRHLSSLRCRGSAYPRVPRIDRIAYGRVRDTASANTMAMAIGGPAALNMPSSVKAMADAATAMVNADAARIPLTLLLP